MSRLFIGLFLIGLLTGCQLLPNENQEQCVVELKKLLLNERKSRIS